MAHIVVFLQRTTRGLHPGSATALCLAREVAAPRGASIMSLGLGDAGAFDDRLIVDASRAGSDQIVFLGLEGIKRMVERLAPRHVFAPYTQEAGSLLAQAGVGPMVGRWIDGPSGDVHKLEPVVGVVTGALPWQQSPLHIEPEYDADVTQVELPDWLVAAAQRATDLTSTMDPPPLLHVGSPLDEATEAALSSLGAYAIEPDQIDESTEGTLLWFDGGEGLPMSLSERNPGLRVILLPGERDISGPLDRSWGLADFVLPGPWPEVVRQFNGTAWKSILA